MSIRDLLRMSLTNLLRRKLRTFLTVLGVVIGTASIVVMLSLGLGLKKSSLKQIEQYGGITTITVYPNEEQSTESGEKNKVQRLDDKAADLPEEKGPLQLFFGNQVIHNFYIFL